MSFLCTRKLRYRYFVVCIILNLVNPLRLVGETLILLKEKFLAVILGFFLGIKITFHFLIDLGY